MAEVGKFRVIASFKARRHTGSHLFESDYTLFRTQRLNVPVMVGANQWTMQGPASPEGAETEAARRFAFDNQGVDSVSGRLVQDGEKLRNVSADPGKSRTLLQYLGSTRNRDLPAVRAPMRPIFRVNQVIPYRFTGSVYHDLIMRKNLRSFIEHGCRPIHLWRPLGPISVSRITVRRGRTFAGNGNCR